MEALPKSLLNKYRTQIGIFLVTVVLVGGGVLALTTGRSKPSEIEKVVVEATADSAPAPMTVIKIDVSGAVANPGVYELSEDGRVEDALTAAGGLSGEADRDWVAKNLNLAAKLSDGDKLYIPKVEEASTTASEPAPVSIPPSVGVVSGAETPASGGSSNCSRVNINKASADTLAICLDGVAEKIARNIIEYRESHGGFKSIEEIQEVSRIGPKTFAKIKDQITVD